MTGMPKLPLLSVPLLLAALPAFAWVSGPAETVLKNSDHQKVGKMMEECITAYVEREGRREAENELWETLEKKWTKPAKGRDPLCLTEDLGAALYYSRNYSKAKGVKKGKVSEFEVPVPYYGADFEASYELWAPSKYNQKTGPYPLIICLPGASASPAEHIEKRWASSEVRDTAIVVSIELPENAEHWATLGLRGDPKNAGGIGILLSIYGDVRDRYAIDHDRVFLVGEGTAAVEAVMKIGNTFPDRFAGVVGISGDAAEISPDNFWNLPSYFAGGGGKATAFAKACKDAGQLEPVIAPEAKEADIWGWMTANPRRSNPAELVLRAGSPFPNKAYWVEIPPRDDSSVARLVAKADRDSNTITIDSEGITSVTLYFNDILVDLDKPVEVIVNGLKIKDQIPRNFNSMMEQIYKGRSDPGKIYTAFKAYDIPKSASEEDSGGE
jgi:hypothetical protein